MDKIKKVNNILKVFIGTVASILTGFVNNYFNHKLDDTKLIWFLTVFTVTVAIIILNEFLVGIFNYSKILRKLTFNDDFIEGFWYDLTIDDDTKLLVHGVVIKIEYSNWDFNVHGVTFNPKGKRIATFKSKESTYKNQVLFFQYESFTEYTESFIEQGISQICFDSPPSSYTGFYFDYSNSLRSRVLGKRVSKKALEEFNNFDSNNDKMNFLLYKAGKE